MRSFPRWWALVTTMVLALTAATGVGASASAVGKAPDKRIQAKPVHTIPALQKWTSTGGEFHYGGTIVVAGGNAELARVGQTFADDIAASTGRRPRVKNGTRGSAGNIVLTLGADKTLGEEGYLLDVNRTLTVSAARPHGVFDGTRSVLQLLHQSKTIPAGQARDWPAKPVRSLLIDNTPKHFSTDFWDNAFRQMSYLKLNDTNLYVDGNGLTDDQMKQIDAMAKRYYIKVVPQLNMPGHMHSVLPSHPEYQLKNADGTKNEVALDLTNPEAVKWALGLIEAKIDLFSGDEWHLGSDEYPGWPGTGENHPQLDAYAKKKFGPDATFADLFADFQNQANALVKKHGKHMRVWNDMIRTSKVVKLDKDVRVEYWIQHPDLPGLKSASDLADEGYHLINAHVDHLYYDQSRRNLDPQDIYEKFEADVYPQNDPVDPSASDGGRMAVWLAWINTNMESDAEVANNLIAPMRAFAQDVWGSPKLTASYAEFRGIGDEVGQPGVHPYSANSIQPDPALAANVDQSMVYAARDAQHKLWAGKENEPKGEQFSHHVMAEGVAGDPVLSRAADGRMILAARTTSGRLLVARQTAPNTDTWRTAVRGVKVNGDPVIVGDRIVVRSGSAITVLDADGLKPVKAADGVLGQPSATLVDGVLTVAARSSHGVTVATAAGQKWKAQVWEKKLASDPVLVAIKKHATVIGVDTHHTLWAGTEAGKRPDWNRIVGSVTGRPSAVVDPKGVAQVAVRSRDGRLLHAFGTTSWTVRTAMTEIVDDPTIGLDGDGHPAMFAHRVRETFDVATPKPKSSDYETGPIVESTTGRPALAVDGHGYLQYLIATTYGDLQTGSKWGAGAGDFGRSFVIGTMAMADDILSPDHFGRSVFEDSFDANSLGNYQVLKPNADEAGPTPTVEGGELAVESSDRYFTVLRTKQGINVGGDVTVITEIGKFSGSKPEQTVFAGFAKDEKNFSMLWYNHQIHRLGFDTRSDGKPAASWGDVPVAAAPGDKLAVTLSGRWMTAYWFHDGQWHRVHASPVNGSYDLADPAVRQQFGYAVGLRATSGKETVTSFGVHQR